MAIASKEALLGASDLTEREVELPSVGLTVRVRSLAAAYANQAQADAYEMVTSPTGQGTLRVNTAKLEELQMLHGLIDPKLDNLDEVKVFATKCGSAWRKVIEAIDSISGIDKEAIESTNATFPVGVAEAEGDDGSNGAAPARSGSDLSVRAGVGVEDAD